MRTMPDRWHITVTEPKDVRDPYVRRFVFDSPHKAHDCYLNAIKAGFEVQVQRVMRKEVERVGHEV
jgi:hypothetical protein